METKKIKQKGRMHNNMTRELERFEEGQKSERHIDLLKTKLKIISHWKTLGHDGIHRFWFKKFPSIHDRLTLEMNICLNRVHIP